MPEVIRMPYLEVVHRSASERRIAKLEGDVAKLRLLNTALVIEAGGKVSVSKLLLEELQAKGADYCATPSEEEVTIEASVVAAEDPKSEATL